MKSKILIAVAVIIVLAVVAYKIIYKPHREISSEKAAYTLTVAELQNAFLSDANAANSRYADKTITISGTVTNIDAEANAIVIDQKLSAVFKQTDARNLKQGQQIEIKGRFVGYDDLLEELKMDQVTLNASENE